MKPQDPKPLFHIFTTLGFAFFLLASSTPNTPQPAAVQSSFNNTPQTIGLINIKNASLETPIHITSLKTNHPISLESTLKNITNHSYRDSIITINPPLTIPPQSQKTIILESTTPPTQNSSLNITGVSYRAHSQTFTKSTNLSVALNSQTNNPSPNSVSIASNNPSSCDPTPAQVCSQSYRADNSDLIEDIENKPSNLDRNNQITTYIPTSPEAWQDIESNRRLGATYEALAVDVPDFIKPEVIYLPQDISPNNKAQKDACQAGLDQEINQLTDLINRQHLLEYALDNNYNLPNLNIISNKCIKRPSYQGGTFDDVYYLLPNNECKSDLAHRIQQELDKTNQDIDDLKLALFEDGKIDESSLNNQNKEAKPLDLSGRPSNNSNNTSDNTSISISAEDKLSGNHQAAQNCRDAINNSGQNTDELFKQHDNNLKKLYGQSCEDAKDIYPQFNHRTDAPTISNATIDAQITRVKVLDNLGCVERKVFKKHVLNKETGYFEDIEKNWCIEEYKFENENNQSCLGYEGLENCGYSLIPIESPTSISPTGYYKIGPEEIRLGGACTGISNMVNYFFSNGRYAGGDCSQELSEFPNRLQNQCFEVQCSNFKNWFKEQSKDVNKSDYSNESSYNEAVWEEVMNNVPDVCEAVTSSDFSNSLIFELGFNKESFPHTEFRYGILSMNVSGDNNIHENLYNNINDPISVFKNKHYDILDDLISGHTSNLGVELAKGAHAIFGYSCNQDASINSFDPNIPSKQVKIFSKENGLWRIPRWNNYFETGENVVITVNKSKYQRLDQCQQNPTTKFSF